MSRRLALALVVLVLLVVAVALVAWACLGNQVYVGFHCAPGFTMVPGSHGAPPECVKP